MKILNSIAPILIYLAYNYFSKMFLALIGLCAIAYVFFYLLSTNYLDCDILLGFAEKFGKKVGTLKGKVVFITGASSGIGEYTALEFAKNGVKLILAARRKDELERVKTACLAASKGLLKDNDILVLQMDVLNFDKHQKFWDEALRHFGHVDILVNNAGRSQRANWEHIDLSVDREMFDLNVFAVVNFSRIAVKYFLENKIEGQIVVTSSLAGVATLPFSGTYFGTKHAIHGYFNCLRKEKKLCNISVTLLCPGPTFTDFLQNSFTENPGKIFGETTQSTDKRMSAKRCGQLCCIAIANKLGESWMGVWPCIPVFYCFVYCPILSELILRLVGPEKLYKLRDSKDNFELPSIKK